MSVRMLTETTTANIEERLGPIYIGMLATVPDFSYYFCMNYVKTNLYFIIKT